MGGLLGWEPASGFINAYFQNIRAACDLPIEASAIAGPLQALLKQQGQTLQGWTGTATELLKELRAIADEEVKRQSNWPKNAQQLSGELKRLAPNFRQKGIHVEHGRNATAKRTRVITVRGEPC